MEEKLPTNAIVPMEQWLDTHPEIFEALRKMMALHYEASDIETGKKEKGGDVICAQLDADPIGDKKFSMEVMSGSFYCATWVHFSMKGQYHWPSIIEEMNKAVSLYLTALLGLLPPDRFSVVSTEKTEGETERRPVPTLDYSIVIHHQQYEPKE